MALYSETVMDHFRNPRNVGVIEDADGVGEVGNAKCGDIMKIYLKIKDNIIEDVKFETFGCGSAIASSSMATEMIKGKPLSEALGLTSSTAPCWLKRPSNWPFRTTMRKPAQTMTKANSPPVTAVATAAATATERECMRTTGPAPKREAGPVFFTWKGGKSLVTRWVKICYTEKKPLCSVQRWADRKRRVDHGVCFVL